MGRTVSNLETTPSSSSSTSSVEEQEKKKLKLAEPFCCYCWCCLENEALLYRLLNSVNHHPLSKTHSDCSWALHSAKLKDTFIKCSYSKIGGVHCDRFFSRSFTSKKVWKEKVAVAMFCTFFKKILICHFEIQKNLSFRLIPLAFKVICVAGWHNKRRVCSLHITFAKKAAWHS